MLFIVVVAFVVGGLLLAVIQRSRRDSRDDTPSPGYSTPPVSTSQPSDDEIICAYAKTLEGESIEEPDLGPFIRRESELPFVKHQIRGALDRALQRPPYRFAPSNVIRCTILLDTFVPDAEYEEAQASWWYAYELLGKSRDEEFAQYLADLPVERQRAIEAALAILACDPPPDTARAGSPDE